MYYPPCCYCGVSVPNWSYNPKLTYVCRDCKSRLSELKEPNLLLTKRNRLRKAVQRIEKVTDIAPYNTGIRWIERNLSHKGWFQSTEEIMVALELIRHKVKTYHQVKIYDFTVDFVLPELKVALEVDGAIYHSKDKAQKSALRDEIIADKLGEGYEVVHIRTENINTNITRLLPAIMAIVRRRRRNRN